MCKSIFTDGKEHCDECGCVITSDLKYFQKGLCDNCSDEIIREIEAENEEM